MKDLADNTKVPSRIYYYLLDWNEQDNKQTIFNQFDKLRLCDLNLDEFKLLFDYAIKCDIKYLKV